MRVLGVDFGGKRIGIASGDTETALPSPKQAIDASGKLSRDAEAIAGLARAESAELVVLGEPLDLNGEPTKMSKICRKLGDEISQTGFNVVFVNEALTSVASHTVLREFGMTAAQRRRHIDSEAACRILERYFEESRA